MLHYLTWLLLWKVIEHLLQIGVLNITFGLVLRKEGFKYKWLDGNELDESMKIEFADPRKTCVSMLLSGETPPRWMAQDCSTQLSYLCYAPYTPVTTLLTNSTTRMLTSSARTANPKFKASSLTIPAASNSTTRLFNNSTITAEPNPPTQSEPSISPVMIGLISTGFFALLFAVILLVFAYKNWNRRRERNHCLNQEAANVRFAAQNRNLQDQADAPYIDIVPPPNEYATIRNAGESRNLQAQAGPHYINIVAQPHEYDAID